MSTCYYVEIAVIPKPVMCLRTKALYRCTLMLVCVFVSSDRYLCLCTIALNARPSLQLVVKLWTLTFGYLKGEQLSLVQNQNQCVFKKTEASFSHRFTSLLSLPLLPCSLHLTPQQQSIFGGFLLLVVLRLNANVLDLFKQVRHKTFNCVNFLSLPLSLDFMFG